MSAWSKLFANFQWRNRPSTETPLGRSNLQKMNDAIDGIDDRVIELDDNKVGNVTVTPVVTEGTTLATITVDGTTTAIKGSDIEVDSTPSTTSTNPLENKAVYELVQSILPEKTATGNPISISDASGLNAKSCSVTMNPIQDLHGYDSPWAGGNGKNKLANNATSGTVNGVTYTVNSDGTITANGTATATSDFYLFGGNNIYADIGLPEGDYLLTGGYSSDVSLIVVRRRDGNNTIFTSYATSAYKVEINIQSGDTFRVFCRTNANATANNAVYSPMLRLATVEDYNYAPYENICPISGRNSVDVLNLPDSAYQPFFDGVKSGTHGFVDLSTLSWVYATSAKRWETQKVDMKSYPSRNADVLFEKYKTDTTATTGDNDKGFISGTVIYVVSTDSTVSPTGMCIYPLATATTPSYTPEQYQALVTAFGGQTKTITFPSTVYGGTDEVIGGVGSETYGYIESYNGETLPGYWISDRDVYAEGTTPTIGAEVCYELATPTPFSTTPTPIGLNKGNNVVSSDADELSLKYSVDLSSLISGE